MASPLSEGFPEKHHLHHLKCFVIWIVSDCLEEYLKSVGFVLPDRHNCLIVIILKFYKRHLGAFKDRFQLRTSA